MVAILKREKLSAHINVGHLMKPSSSARLLDHLHLDFLSLSRKEVTSLEVLITSPPTHRTKVIEAVNSSSSVLLALSGNKAQSQKALLMSSGLLDSSLMLHS